MLLCQLERMVPAVLAGSCQVHLAAWQVPGTACQVSMSTIAQSYSPPKLLLCNKRNARLFLKRQFCDDNSTTVNQRIERLKSSHNILYPSGFKVTHAVSDILEKYANLYTGEVAVDTVAIGGMFSSIRSSGKKIKFIDMIGNGSKIQLKVHANKFSSTQDFLDQIDALTRGDRIGVVGKPCRTKSGELSIDCSQVELLSPCLRVMPQKIESGQKRLRRRYIDYLTNPDLRSTLVTRARIIKLFRQFFDELDFMEVETPILAHNVGGASAAPFITHHNEMKTNLYLRVAPELYLKQLVIAGFDRVYEIGKLFRNEGVDPSHNPEFTSCEFYMAFATYKDLMTLTNQLFSKLVNELNLEPKHEGTLIDFSSEYKRIEFLPSIEQAINRDLPPPSELNNNEDSIKLLTSLCKELNITIPPPVTVPRILDKLFSKLIEPELIQPTFVTKHPMLMSPLAKPDSENPHLAQRFELFATGLELCNAYTELNDPMIQRATLAQQAGLADPEAMIPDEDYCVALEYGLPPTAGWGCGIDRLTAILTNNSTIKETITFPLTKSH
eukprot:TRINITY_DN10017_c0_g2_i1.p1 TRINITY_DN10017_c0_g2~~TRINITY_DN10017_c0_g2_i1.p1  ORF type:complete len:565 (-),score=64.51 TRINITY_DN10017_c0_g2_i1:109-1770(-)